MTPAWRWGSAVVALLAGNVAAMAWLAVSAQRDRPAIVDDYYARATRFDDESRELAASRALGWSADVSLAGATISVVLRDAAGAPVRDAIVTLEGAHRAQAHHGFALALSTTASDGRYIAHHDLTPGIHDLVLHAARRDSMFVVRLTAEAP